MSHVIHVRRCAIVWVSFVMALVATLSVEAASPEEPLLAIERELQGQPITATDAMRYPVVIKNARAYSPKLTSLIDTATRRELIDLVHLGQSRDFWWIPLCALDRLCAVDADTGRREILWLFLCEEEHLRTGGSFVLKAVWRSLEYDEESVEILISMADSMRSADAALRVVHAAEELEFHRELLDHYVATDRNDMSAVLRASLLDFYLTEATARRRVPKHPGFDVRDELDQMARHPGLPFFVYVKWVPEEPGQTDRLLVEVFSHTTSCGTLSPIGCLSLRLDIVYRRTVEIRRLVNDGVLKLSKEEHESLLAAEFVDKSLEGPMPQEELVRELDRLERERRELAR